MRLVSVARDAKPALTALAILLLVLLPVTVACAGNVTARSGAADAEIPPPDPDHCPSAGDASPLQLLALLWPFGLMLGTISIDLKRQLQRRGTPADRRQAFSDFVILGSRRPAGPDRASGDRSASQGQITRN